MNGWKLCSSREPCCYKHKYHRTRRPQPTPQAVINLVANSTKSSLVMISVGLLKPSLYGIRSSPFCTCQPYPQMPRPGNGVLTKHNIDPFLGRIPLGARAKHSKVQRRLETTKLVLARGKDKGWVDGARGSNARPSGLGRVGDGDDVLAGKVGDVSRVDGWVEAVIVPEVEVAAREGAVVFNDCEWMLVAGALVGWGKGTCFRGRPCPRGSRSWGCRLSRWWRPVRRRDGTMRGRG